MALRLSALQINKFRQYRRLFNFAIFRQALWHRTDDNLPHPPFLLLITASSPELRSSRAGIQPQHKFLHALPTRIIGGRLTLNLHSADNWGQITEVRYELNEEKRADLPDAVRKGTLFNVYLTLVIVKFEPVLYKISMMQQSRRPASCCLYQWLR